MEFTPPSALSRVNRLVGVGLQLFDPLDGQEDLVVVAPVPESPAEQAGIRPLDRVLKVADLDVSQVHLTADEAMSLLRGPQGSSVSLLLQSARNADGGVEEGKDALGDRLPRQMDAWMEPDTPPAVPARGGGLESKTLQRQALNIPPVRAGVVESPFRVGEEEGEANGEKNTGVGEHASKQHVRNVRFGYVRINYFNRVGTDLLADALKQMDEQGVDGVIIDVRNCLGGMFKEALMAGAMLLGGEPKDATLVDVIDASGIIKKMKVQKQRDLDRWPLTNGFPLAKTVLRNKPVRIITNRGSASSSEVLAMALVGNGRGQLVGERTFGKALIQKPYALADGSVIKLTVAEYLSPHAQHLGRGLEPDTLCAASPAPKAADQCARMAQYQMVEEQWQGNFKFEFAGPKQRQGAAGAEPGGALREGPASRAVAVGTGMPVATSGPGLGANLKYKEGLFVQGMWERGSVWARDWERFQPLKLQRPERASESEP